MVQVPRNRVRRAPAPSPAPFLHHLLPSHTAIAPQPRPDGNTRPPHRWAPRTATPQATENKCEKTTWHGQCNSIGQEKQIPASPAANNNNNRQPGVTGPAKPTTTTLAGRPPRHDDRTTTIPDACHPLEPTTTIARGTGRPGRDAPVTAANKNKGRRGAPPATTPTSRGEAIHLPSWLDYCFEYEAVTFGSANKDNNTACLNPPW